MTTTLLKLLAAIEGEVERDPIPAAILARAELRAGKRLDARDANALEEEFPGVRFQVSPSFGRNVNLSYWAIRGARNFDELKARGVPDYDGRREVAVAERGTHTTKGGGIAWGTSQWIREHNVWCFAARDVRNASRASFVANEKLVARVAHLIDGIADMRAELVGTIESDDLDDIRHTIGCVLEARAGTKIAIYS